jgi:hypothetical protein
VFKVIVSPAVSRRLGELVRHRESLIWFLNKLYSVLPQVTHQHRQNRDPTDPDQFLYSLSRFSNGTWLNLTFAVNDAMATDRLFVEAVAN